MNSNIKIFITQFVSKHDLELADVPSDVLFLIILVEWVFHIIGIRAY